MTDPDDFDPTPYIVPNDEHHPNPYEEDDFDGKQDEFDDSEKAEGLGGEALPDAPLTVLEGRKRLRQLIESGSTTDWDGETIKGYCLRVQRKAQQIPPLHTDAQQDYDESPEKIPCTFETVNWDALETGDRLYFKSGSGGSGHGHIVDYLNIPNHGPLCITTDVPSGKVGICDPHWFRDNWGMELEGASKVVNGHRVHVTKDKDQGGNKGGQQGDGGNDSGRVPHQNVLDAQHDIAAARNLLIKALKENPDNDRLKEVLQPVIDNLAINYHDAYGVNH